MPETGTMLDKLHQATHRIPGVPPHSEQPAGHQGQARHGRSPHLPTAHHRAQNHPAHHHRGWSHPARQPRVLVGWQRRIAAFFGQQLP
jgi:hypothetical protein